jgi:DNA-binding transcriptional LysR family regulator
MATLLQMQTFYWVCRAGTFAAAAERMHSTQPGVSQRIRELEQSLGIQLFDRVGRTARLTPKGRELLDYAERLITIFGEIEAAVASPAVIGGTVRLGASDFVAVTWLPRLVAAIHEQYPNLKLELTVDLGPNIQRNLDAGEVDIAIIPEPVLTGGYTSAYLGHVPFAWMASPRLKVPRRLTPSQLADWPNLSLAARSNSYRLTDQWFARNRAAVRRMHICNNLQVLISMTVAGLGISHLPIEFVQPHIRQKKLHIVQVAPALKPYEYRAVWDLRQPSVQVRTIAELAVACSSFKRRAKPAA